MKKKKIALILPVGLRIPPKKAGGIESMVYNLSEGLVKRGHKVLLFGPKTTKGSSELISTCSKPISEYNPSSAEISRKLRIELSCLSIAHIEILKKKKDIDIVFNHTVDGGFFAPLEKLLDVPVFHTLHLPIFDELAAVYKNWKPRLVSISANQRSSYPNLNYQSTIYNGINTKKIPFSASSEDYFLFSSKIMCSKNPFDAIRVAKNLNIKLYISGKIGNEQYFQHKIKPNLSKKIRYLKELSFPILLNVYKRSRALIFPIAWEEPFGLAMIEAMACGTPVIAYARGSVPEIVEDGVTGFIVNSSQTDKRGNWVIKKTGIRGLEEAVDKITSMSKEEYQKMRYACREHVEQKFSIEKMIDGYENLYLNFLNKK